MREKEGQKLGWKEIGLSAVMALGLYGMLPLLGAALVSGEKVGQGSIGWLCAAFSAVAVFAGEAVFLRKIKRGRLGSCLLGGGLFVVAVVLVGLIGGGEGLSGLVAVAPGAAFGAAAAAVSGGGKSRGRRGRGR